MRANMVSARPRLRCALHRCSERLHFCRAHHNLYTILCEPGVYVVLEGSLEGTCFCRSL